MSKYRTKACAKLSEHANIKGFRKGTEISEDILVSHFGEEMIQHHMLEEALETLYRKALKKADVLPVDHGSIKEIKSYSPLELTMTVEVYPDIKIDQKKVKKISVKTTPVSVSAEEIQAEIDTVAEQHVSWTPRKTSAIKSGDRVLIDAQGYDKK